MQTLSTLQGWIVFALSVVALGVEVYAFVDCVRRRPDAFPAAGKRTKSFWLIVTVIAMLLGIVSLGGLPGLLAHRRRHRGRRLPRRRQAGSRPGHGPRGRPHRRALRPLVRRHGIPGDARLADAAT